MRIKDFHTFNESLGISKDLVDQVDEYYKEIQNEPRENIFSFVYYSAGKNTFFKVTVDPKMGNAGDFNSGNLNIRIKNRKDKPTLLHEVKHLDHFLRKGRKFATKKYPYGDWSCKDTIKYIAYVYEPTEIESKYHGYYAEVNSYISKKIKDNPSPDKHIIVKWVNEALSKSSDHSYTWYSIEDLFKLKNHMSNNKMYDLYLMMKNKGKSSLVDKVLNLLGINWNKDFDQFITDFNESVNRKQRKCWRKFRRIYSVFIDKYATN